MSQFRLSLKQDVDTPAVRPKSPKTHDQGQLRNIGGWYDNFYWDTDVYILTTLNRDACYFSVRPHGQAKDLLGLGKVLVAVESGDTSSKLWVIFHSEGKKQHECRWFRKLSPGFVLPALHEDPNRGKAFVTYKAALGKTSSISMMGFYPDTGQQHDKSTSIRANLGFVLTESAFNPFERTRRSTALTAVCSYADVSSRFRAEDHKGHGGGEEPPRASGSAPHGAEVCRDHVASFGFEVHIGPKAASVWLL